MKTIKDFHKDCPAAIWKTLVPNMYLNLTYHSNKHSSWWSRLEDFFHLRLQKTSSRRLGQEECIRLTHTSSDEVFKTSSSRPIYSSWSYVFKTSCENVLKAISRRFQHIFKTSSRHLQNFFKTSCKNVFKTTSRLLAKMSSRRFQDVLSSKLFLVTQF